jgi:hypothetical protein
MTGYSIVLIGNFDPISAQPAKLIQNGLLDESDLNGLEYDVLLKDFAVARLPWIQFSIELEKFSVNTTLQSPAPEPIRDFVLDFAELMPNCRFSALGLTN